MQYITHHYLFQKPPRKQPQNQPQNQQGTSANNKWLRRIYTTGFVFFLIKGLAWIAAAAWVVY
ncbi:MAG: hypothetical protein GQ549_08310 [Gammaproteobacteria bacterium]|nr:hypothetical protein [Gammaproteobacteria bacterium]